jgi:hypothetical protein
MLKELKGKRVVGFPIALLVVVFAVGLAVGFASGYGALRVILSLEQF